MTKAELNALNNLKAIEQKFDALTEEEFNILADATTEYEFGNMTKAQLNTICRRYHLSATEALVYLAVWVL